MFLHNFLVAESIDPLPPPCDWPVLSGRGGGYLALSFKYFIWYQFSCKPVRIVYKNGVNYVFVVWGKHNKLIITYLIEFKKDVFYLLTVLT